MAADDIKRRKPDDERKTETLRVRLTPQQDAEIRAAAKHAGIPVSSWVVLVLMKAVREELSSATPKSPSEE